MTIQAIAGNNAQFIAFSSAVPGRIDPGLAANFAELLEDELLAGSAPLPAPGPQPPGVPWMPELRQLWCMAAVGVAPSIQAQKDLKKLEREKRPKSRRR